MKIKAWVGVKFLQLNFGFALQEQGEITCKEKLSAVTCSGTGQGLELGQSTLLCRAESLLQPLLNQKCIEKPRTKQNVKSWLP